MDMDSFNNFEIKQPEKVLEQIVSLILDEQKTEYSDDQNLNQKLSILKSVDPDIHSSFNKFHIAWMAYSFTRQDKELKMKMEDIWEGQLTMYRQVAEAKISEFIELLKQKDMDTAKIINLSDSLF